MTGGHGWIIPGGKVEPREVNNPSVSAIREAREEGGVVGKGINTWKFPNSNGFYF